MSQNKPTSNDSELFRQMMTDVKPLSAKKSAEKHIEPEKPRPTPRPANDPPSLQKSPSHGFTEREHIADVAPEEALFFARAGLQQRLLRQFKRGNLQPEGRLDLHGQTIAEAGTSLFDFLNHAQNEGLRCICVIHGKGHRSANNRPALKTQVNQWLRDAPAVLAFSSAQAKDGGMGALYVLLRRDAKR